MNIQNVVTTFSLSEPNDRFGSQASYIGDGKKGYVPLYTINLPKRTYEYVNYRTLAIDKNALDEIGNLLPERFKDSIKASKLEGNVLGKLFTKDLRLWIDSEPKYELIPENNNRGYQRGLSNFDYVINYAGPCEYYIGSNIYITHYGAMFHVVHRGTISLVEPLWVLVTKKKYVRLVRMKWLLGEKIPNNWIEMWINPKLDVTDSKWKSLRTKYRSSIKSLLVSKNIRIVEKSDILETLFNTTEVPKFRSPKEYKAWLSGIAESYLSTVYRRSSVNELISIL